MKITIVGGHFLKDALEALRPQFMKRLKQELDRELRNKKRTKKRKLR